MNRDKEWADEAEKWFYNLDALGKVVEANQRADKRSRRRILVLAVFTLFAFLSLAARQQYNIGLIDDNQRAIQQQQIRSCQSGIVILTKFNDLQDKLADIERHNRYVDQSLRDRRIAAYESARILPLPVCAGVRR